MTVNPPVLRKWLKSPFKDKDAVTLGTWKVRCLTRRCYDLCKWSALAFPQALKR